jgi:hypothetical protein
VLGGWNAAHWSTSSEYIDASISDWQNAINNVSFLLASILRDPVLLLLPSYFIAVFFAQCQWSA